MNKTRKHLTSLAVAVAATCAVSASAFAQPGGHHQGPKDGRPGAHAQNMHQKGAFHRHNPGAHGKARFDHMRGLNLTEEQRDKIFEIRHAAAPEARQAMKEVAEARKALHEQVHAEQFDEAKAKEAADRQGAAIAKATLLRAKTQSQIHAVLMPEQRQQLEQRRDGKRTPGKAAQPSKAG